MKVSAGGKSTHSGQVDVGNDDLVEGRGSVLARLAGVTARVVLVFGIAASLPGLGVGGLCDGVLRRGRSGVTREVPASETESTGHDGEKDLYGSKDRLVSSLIRLVISSGFVEVFAQPIPGIDARIWVWHVD